MPDDRPADDHTGTADAPHEPRKAPAHNGAFLAIGFVFLILGITQMTSDGGGGVAFLGVGATFIALAGASRASSRKDTEAQSDGGERLPGQPKSDQDPTGEELAQELDDVADAFAIRFSELTL